MRHPKQTFRAACALALTLAVPSLAPAAEPVTRFVAGLERQGLHDLALSYLDGLAGRADLSAATRETLPFEQAAVHQHAARRSLDAGTAERHLLAARERYASVRALRPEHTRGIEAGRQLGYVLAELAQRKLAQARHPLHAGQRAQLEQESRAYFAAALQQADVSVRELEARLEKLPRKFDR